MPLTAGSHHASRTALILSLFFAAVSEPARGQPQPVTDEARSLPVGSIDVYGLLATPERAVRGALELEVGDLIPTADEARQRLTARLTARVEAIPGVMRAAVRGVCCADGRFEVFVGVQERGAESLRFRPVPELEVTLPAEIVDTYQEFEDAIRAAIQQGDAGDDLSQGHSLVSNPRARALQQRFIGYSQEHQDIVSQVLREAADPDERGIAAFVLGYVADKRTVIDDLIGAGRDPDETVRNNAVRSLGAIASLAAARPDLDISIPAGLFIDMLQSLSWTDRNKAMMVLTGLTERRDTVVLGQLRDQAVAALVEMTRWQGDRSFPPYRLLGRVAEVPEDEIVESWVQGDRERVLDRFLGSP